MSDAPERLKISRGMVQFLAATQNRTAPDDPEYFRAPTVTPDVEAALEALEYMETGPAEGDHGDAAALVASTLRALTASEGGEA